MTMTETTTTAAPELAQSLTVSYADAFKGIAAVLPHASKDDVTPIIQTVQVTPEHFITTDRYAIGRYKHGAAIHPDVDAVIIPRAAAEWLTKQTAKMLNRDARYLAQLARVTFTADSITITGSDAETLAATTFGVMAGNFPPVHRLIDGWKPATDAQPVGLKGEFLTRFATSAAKLADKPREVEPLLIELGESSTGKPGPVRVRIGERFDGLLQPNLIR